MFSKLFNKGSKERKTGVYKYSDGKLVELDEMPGDGSINSIIKSLGFELPQVHTIFTFDSKLISTIGVKILTKEVVFAATEEGVRNLTIPDLNKELETVDWQFEYSSSGIEDILNEGIENGSLDYDFLRTVTNLKKESESIFHAVDLELYLYFKDGLLTNIASSDWLNTASKWLRDLNGAMFESMLSEANRFHDSEIDAIEEVNMQCNSLRSIPNAIENEFIPLHTKQSGNINFYNILLAHYDHDANIEEFKQVNKGRFKPISEEDLEVGNFIYQFDSAGSFRNVTKK